MFSNECNISILSVLHCLLYSNTNRIFRDYLTVRRLRPALERSLINALPDEPENLADLYHNVLQYDRYWSLCAVSEVRDSIFGGSSTGQDGTCTVLFMSQRCVDFMKTTQHVFGFSLTVPILGSYYIVS